jgi:hypothetical protein
LKPKLKEQIMPKITKNSNLAPYSEFAALETISGAPDMAKVNKFTVAPIKEEDIRIYQALLIDDQVTRNSTHYPADFQKGILSLPAGEGNFVGAPILFGDDKDHKEAASAQVGRIFDAWQVTDAAGHVGVMAKFYVPKANREELIGKIDSGVLKEVSISTKVEMPICSICHQDIRTCGHTMGKEGCHVSMTGKGFCAEVSLVAVPGSSQAKILSEASAAKYSPMEMLEAVKGLIKEELQKFAEITNPVDAAKKTWSTIRKVNTEIAAEKGATARQAALGAIKAGKVPTAIEQTAQAGAAKLDGARFGEQPWTGPNPKIIDGAQKTVIGAGQVASGAVTGAIDATKSAAAGMTAGVIGGRGIVPPKPPTAAGMAGAFKGITPKNIGYGAGALAATALLYAGGKALVGAIRNRKKKKQMEQGQESLHREFLPALIAGAKAVLPQMLISGGIEAIVGGIRARRASQQQPQESIHKESAVGDFFRKIKDNPDFQKATISAKSAGANLKAMGSSIGAAVSPTISAAKAVGTKIIPRSLPGIVGTSVLGTLASMATVGIVNKVMQKAEERKQRKALEAVPGYRRDTTGYGEALAGEEFTPEELDIMMDLGFDTQDLEEATPEELDALIQAIQGVQGEIDGHVSTANEDKEILLHFGVTEEEMDEWSHDDVEEVLAAFGKENGIVEDEPIKATEGFNPITLTAGALIGGLLYKAYKAKAENEGKSEVPPVIINIQAPQQTQSVSASPSASIINPWRPVMSYRMVLNATTFKEAENSLKFTPDELTFLNAIGLDVKEASELTPEQLNQLIALLEGHKAQIEGTPDAPGLTPVEEPVVKSTEALEEPVIAEIDTLLGLEPKMDEAYTTIASMAGKYGVEFNIGTSQVNQDDKFAMSDKYFNRLQDMDLTLRNIEAKLGITPDVTAAYEDNGDNRSKVAYISQKLDNVMKRVYTLKGRIGMEDASKLELVKEAIRAGVLAGTIAVGTQDDAERLYRNMSVAEIKKSTEAFTEKAKTAFWSVKEAATEQATKTYSDREIADAVSKSRRK